MAFLRGESAAFVWHFICHTGKQLFVKEIISGEAVYHNRCFGLRVDSYVMPGSTADVSAYRSVKFNFFVLNPTPCGVYCGSLPVVQSVFPSPSFIGYVMAATV